MSWSVQVCSPVHIGCGATALPMEYLVANGRAYYVPAESLVDAFERVGLRQETWLNLFSALSPSDASAGLRAFLDQRAPGWWEKIRQAIIHGAHRYTLPAVGEPTQEVRLETKLEPDRVYIPGSSIKGAMRTAVLYGLLEEDPARFRRVVLDKLREFRKRHDRLYEQAQHEGPGRNAKRELAKCMNETFAGINREGFEAVLLHGREPAPHYSVFRHLLAADTEHRPASRCLALVRAEVIGSRRSMAIWQEVILPGTQFRWRGVELEAHKAHMRGGMWQMLAHSQQYPASAARCAEDATYVFQCLRRFALAILRAEVQYWGRELRQSGRIPQQAAQRASPYRAHIIEQLRDLKEKIDRGAVLLRLGANEGLLSTTICLLVRERDPDLYRTVIVPATQGRAYPDLFPKTRRVVHVPDAPPALGGWVELVSPGTA